MVANCEKGNLCFPKEERLHHRSLVEGLFRKGTTFYDFPFRVTWRTLSSKDLENNFRNNVPPGIGSLQILVTVPKKKRRKAVDRVQMRRRIREAYRLNRIDLRNFIDVSQNIKTLSVGMVYIHDKNLPFSTIENKMKSVLAKLQLRLNPKEVN